MKTRHYCHLVATVCVGALASCASPVKPTKVPVSASLDDGELLTRILDFKEDLHRECFRSDCVSVSNPAAVDSALMPVSFSVSSKGALAEFSRLIKKSVLRYQLEHVVRITRR